MKNKPSQLKSLFLAMLFVASSIALNAQGLVDATDVPRTMSYQGLLTSSDGTPFVDGQYEITVTLYADGRGDNAVWQDSYLTNVSSGVFSVLLGSGSKALPNSDKLSTPLWVGTAFNGAAEMRPLTPMTASPYALNVPDQAITTNKLAANAVTADKVGMDYIAGLEIDGQQVTGNGAMLKLKSSDKIALTYDEVSQTVMIDEASHATGTTGDDEKGASTLASPLAWDSNGDLTSGTAGGQPTAAGDFLGTTAANPADLIIKVAGQQTMQFQQTGIAAIPNIIGGQANAVTAATSVASVIAGGTLNSIQNGNYNAVGGGTNNAISNGINSTIGGGEGNSISLLASTSPFDHATIGGGRNNAVTNGLGFIGGGLENRVDGAGSVVVGGGYNIISAIYANNVIGGGGQNEIAGASAHSTIGGGVLNTITDSWYSVLGGGDFSSIENGDHNIIGAGSNNYILNTTFTTISGGFHNIIDGSDYSTIGGGKGNRIMTAGTMYGTVGGGHENTVQGSYGTIPGGDKLSTAASYAQVAVGFYNDPRGSTPIRPGATTIALTDDPLFMVGNGDVNAAVPSNAFEVSYNGHTSVTGVNGQGNPSSTGGTYVDNVVYAWGHYDPAAGQISDFGVVNVVPVGVGVYDVTIAVTDPAGNPITLTNASITVTIVDKDPFVPIGCTSVTTTPIGALGLPANTFRVRTWSLNSTCSGADLPFMFKVTGRP